ncbi:hypothetical protein [Shewanella dokdonensis]|uniref:Uncharacterized protein n=1 Tax=Shewanella dokdonensis TaxID=712036 RepID=A0ABX8DHK8_9GAMM|nr:hypothetical protein [Shewanella dokdonensis]MCL1075934.1 hypothetical protein [Shewanella dokdonensis]QVK24251.1 hypothetical protein KHX94_06790 [Shewanella dokdonensis]
MSSKIIKYERIQREQHVIAGIPVQVSYDRFTTRFTIAAEGCKKYSKMLCFWPVHNAKFTINSNSFNLKIRYFLLWSAKVTSGEEVVVQELLPRRRRRAMMLLGYSVFIILIKTIMVIMAA